MLDVSENTEPTDGTIEDDSDDSWSSSLNGGAAAEAKVSTGSDPVCRCVHIMHCAISIWSRVEGFTSVSGMHNWRIKGRLAEKLVLWKEEDHVEQLKE